MADRLINSDALSIESLQTRHERDAADEERSGRDRAAAWLRLVWCSRGFILRSAGISLVLSTLIAFLIPKQFRSAARLMPTDQGRSGLSMLAAASGSIGGKFRTGPGYKEGDVLG